MSFLSGIVCLLCVYHLMGQSKAAKLSVGISKHEVSKAESVDITCSLDGKDSDSREVVILQISGPYNAVLVSLHQGEKIFYNEKLSDRFKASGSVDDASLTLTISDIKPQDYGQYTCGVTYINAVGTLVTHEAKRNLSESDVAAVLGQKIDSLVKIVNELSRKASLKSSFAVTSLKDLSIKVGEKIAFPNVLMTNGLEGYNKYTGVYTVPADGIYVFHLTIALNCKKCNLIGYLKAGEKTLGGFGAHDNTYYDQTSISVSVSLNKGEEVYVVPSFVGNGAKIGEHQFTNFNGFLLEPF